MPKRKLTNRFICCFYEVYKDSFLNTKHKRIFFSALSLNLTKKRHVFQ